MIVSLCTLPGRAHCGVDMEMPCYLPKLLFELNEQRKRDFFCDCSILVEGRVFKAHRNVLFAGSGYFRALLVHYLQVTIAAIVLGGFGERWAGLDLASCTPIYCSSLENKLLFEQ